MAYRYKTIVLELIQHRPEMHERLRKQRMLLPTMEHYAGKLKDLHEAWMQQLSEANPGSGEIQIASRAMELALKELEDSLPSASSSEDEEPPSLDGLMTFLRAHTPAG
ncbi:MAG TPA: hypothetical protein VMF69_04905 [Gemmataceae bacterium]|nr:hypothetical protein [Gemmataceae bacterium]